jgi:aryl-alcohol dehydrogenase-like predicted oxidoreductase
MFRQEANMTRRIDESDKKSRREFLKVSGAVGAAAVLSQTSVAGTTSPITGLPSNPVTASAMPTRNLGKTGYRVGIFSLGGQAALERGNNHDVAVPIIERALDLGVNYIDTSSIYGGPERWSEQYIGAVMKHRRKDAFLATKTRERSRDDSMRMIEKSLTLLNTDHVDLWQLHDIGTMTDVNAVFGKGGAMEALQEAKEQGIVRHLGFTGHFRPDALMECARRFNFDTVLMAVSAADKHHYSFIDELVPMAVEKQMGIIGMKVPGRGRLLTSWNPPPIERQKHMWEGSVIATQPGTLNMREAMFYALSLPVSTVIIGIDSISQLEENVRLAREFTPLSEKQMASISTRAEPVSKQALFFRFMERA